MNPPVPPGPEPDPDPPEPPEPTYAYNYVLKVQNGMNQTYDYKVGFGSGTSDVTPVQTLQYNAIGTFEYHSNDPINQYIRVYRGDGYSAQSFGIISGCEYYNYLGSPQKNSIVPSTNGTYDVYVAGNEASNRFELEE